MEPGAAGYPGSLPACAEAPIAMLFVHDLNNPDYTYANTVLGCERVLRQNGCSNTKCDPMDTTLTTPYLVPAGVELPARTGVNSGCVSFRGCPSDYPVVFCLTTNQGDGDGQAWGVVPLAWDFFQKLTS